VLVGEACSPARRPHCHRHVADTADDAVGQEAICHTLLAYDV
jgi:hypothetical protein